MIEERSRRRPRTTRWTTRLRGALVVTIVLALCSCTVPRDVTEGGVEKAGTGELRTDLDPLVKRLPRLVDATSAEWMSGTLGDDSVPGPSSYWIDAVVTLDEETLQEVLALPDLEDADSPEVVSGLQASVPDAAFQRSEDMDSLFSAAEWSAEAWLAPEEGKVVLFILGGN